ncbi:hypothetical protein EJ02DRAFT_347687 [Clathrospora elynae]|uniref:Uncharacterized protein n=1 Tax=Clathrospora elynae TaxID=706981 RepID=A0A6A5SSD4_9PLEO|nr:hypothetical protein EJ02DRAFT_347687 [Clathrospora elynae]
MDITHKRARDEQFHHGIEPSKRPTAHELHVKLRLHDNEPHILRTSYSLLEEDWMQVQCLLPDIWKWDVEYQNTHTEVGGHHGSWTCTPLEPDEPKCYPLTIASAPVVLPVEYQWPPIGGVTPPPDPRPSAPIDPCAKIPLEVVRDLFLTFEGSIGFYLLINGLLQVIVPNNFDTAWASSHLPHKYGGLKVCYISQTMEPTMLPSKTATTGTSPSLMSPSSSISNIFRLNRPRPVASLAPALKINDFIEARPRSSHKKEKYSGRIGLKVSKDGDPYLVISTHVITEAILAKSHRDAFFGGSRDDRFEKLEDDWNEHVEIWAGNEKIGSISKTFDPKANLYPNGFHHDITLIAPTSRATTTAIKSLVPNLGWLHRSSWTSLRRQISPVSFLSPTENQRAAKTIKCSLPSEVLVVGEGIFLNQTSSTTTLKDHDTSTWKCLVSRALLYRVCPDLDPPNGYSGMALYAMGEREDGTQGPGVVGFQSFVQRSGQVQNFAMSGPALERRLQMGRVAFYGAFEVPRELKGYDII